MTALDRLAEIEQRAERQVVWIGDVKDMAAALRAVLVAHRHRWEPLHDDGLGYCEGWVQPHPCPTVQAVTQILEGASCVCCGTDARDEQDVEERDGKRWCSFCIGCGHDRGDS